MTRVRIALVQMAAEESLEANLRNSLGRLEEAASEGAQLVCFPELQFSPFFPQFAESDSAQYLLPIDHAAMRALRDKCRQHKVVGVLNTYLSENGSRYDASPVIDADGSLIGVSKMVHIVQAPKYYEQSYYDPSDVGFQVFDTAVGKIGVVICYDRHFPESFRICKLQGAQIVVIPTANHNTEPNDKFAWEVRVAAMQNEFFVAMCNRVGREHEMEFCGESLVADPDGEIVAQADNREQILYADMDLSSASSLRVERQYLKLRNAEFCRLS